MAQQLCRPWDPPTQQNTIVRLPGRTVAQPLSQSPGGAILEVVGHFSHFECLVDAPDTWVDVTFRCVRSIGGIDSIVGIRTLADLQNPIVTGARIGGVLFSIRGRPGDRFKVEAWEPAENLAEAKFYALAWGEDGVFGDQATRLPIDLWVPEGYERSFTTGLAGLAAGTTIIFAANPLPRGRVAMKMLEWTRTEVGGATLLLQEVTPAAVPIVHGTWAHRGSATDGKLSPTVWDPPLYSQPGSRWELVLSAGAAANNFVNALAFNDGA